MLRQDGHQCATDAARIYCRRGEGAEQRPRRSVPLTQKGSDICYRLVYVVDALKRWEPRVAVTSVKVTRERQDGENVLAIRLR